MRVQRTGSPRARVRAAFLVAVALLVPAAILFGLLWSLLAADTARTERALDGVAHLQPTGALLAALADTEGAAAREEPVDGDALRAAVADLDAVHAARGELLGTASRWTDLRERVTGLADVRPVGPGGAAQVAEVSVLAAEFTDATAAGAGALDDGGVFADLVTTGLPDVLGASGRLVSAAVSARPEEPLPLGREFAARESLAERVDAVDGLLRRAGAGAELDQTFIARAGDYRAAAAAAVPPGPFAATAPIGDPERTRAQQQVLVRTTADLHRAALTELSARLEARLAGLGTTSVATALAGLAALAVAGWLLWTGLPSRRDGDPGDGGEADDALGDEPAEPDVVMVDARSLLAEDPDELVRVGRAVHRRREPGDDPA